MTHSQKDLNITTTAISINVIKIGKRQMTLAVFKQLDKKEIDDIEDINIWGRVNYSIKNSNIEYNVWDDKHWIVYEHEGAIYKDSVEIYIYRIMECYTRLVENKRPPTIHHRADKIQSIIDYHENNKLETTLDGVKNAIKESKQHYKEMCAHFQEKKIDRKEDLKKEIDHMNREIDIVKEDDFWNNEKEEVVLQSFADRIEAAKKKSKKLKNDHKLELLYYTYELKTKLQLFNDIINFIEHYQKLKHLFIAV